ncbi:hypothetical protein ACS0TY_014752 [Phlomoides rotata]
MDSSALVIVLVVLLWASFHVLNPGAFPVSDHWKHSPTRSESPKLTALLMSLLLGRTYAVVVSSPDVAKQVLREHDQALCSRSVISAAEAHNFHKNSLGFLPVGSSIWKRARKICREHLFWTNQLDESQGLRLEKLTPDEL